MAGTARGGRLAAQTNKKRHGSDFYAKIGRKGGQSGTTGGFAAGSEGRKRASFYGSIGGSHSRRG
jgi:general stress protein YciG